MTPTKYAEWITQPCGKCRLHIDIGTIVEDDIDPTCKTHQKFKCVTCGDTVDGATITHGA